MMKLARVSFKCKNIGMRTVFEAFKAPYPSLNAVTLDGIRAALYGHEQQIIEEIKTSSVDGRWPARVLLVQEHYICLSQRISIRCILTPFVGDRHFVVHSDGERDIRCDCNYSERPSRTAAADVIAIVQSARGWFLGDNGATSGLANIRLFNQPVWAEDARDA
jgi:hypothetical protein